MKEALKLALEALEWCHGGEPCGTGEAITAIKAALAQPVQEPTCPECKAAVLYECVACSSNNYPQQPAQEPWCMKMNGCKTKCEDCPDEAAQEPVAWMDEEKKIIYWHNTHETDDHYGFKRTTPLYTTPQQRPWVGLTEAQFLEATRLAENGNYLVAFVRIQGWLKEQNNG